MIFSSLLTTSLLAVTTNANPIQGERLQPRDVYGDEPAVAIHGPPPPPKPERIEITTLPMPPVTTGTCDNTTNPHRTGCTGPNTGLFAGNFLPDGNHILAAVNYTGAPAAPDPRSIYTGMQIIVIKTDGTLFSNGDAWKCITCGMPTKQDFTITVASKGYSYPQAFKDGTKLLAGYYIVSCGDHQLVSDACTPDQVSIHQIHFNNQADGSGSGASIRELRLHPDNVHIGFSSFTFSGGALGQFAYIGRLNFNKNATVGLPLGPRYDITNANVLIDTSSPGPIYTTDNKTLHINTSAIEVGELRAFSGTGREVTYIGYPSEACNIDVYAADLVTGAVRRLTTHPGYVDPIEFSPNDEWMVIMDTRGSGRTEFMAGVRGIPPVTDLITSTACSSVRNNGNRRFFQPFLLDKYGDRGDYYGQEINGGSAGVLGSGAIDDPQWNGQADPWFSPDGTKIVYWQAQAVSPACGGSNPLPCFNSTEPGGRQQRIMLAHLVDRQPCARKPVHNLSDTIPWATKYTPGASVPSRPLPGAGIYTLAGAHSGDASVQIKNLPNTTIIGTVAVTFNNYSDDGLSIFHGYQNISAKVENFVDNLLDWYADVRREGYWPQRQTSSEGGLHFSINVLTNLFEASNGTLVSVVDGVTYRQPGNWE